MLSERRFGIDGNHGRKKAYGRNRTLRIDEDRYDQMRAPRPVSKLTATIITAMTKSKWISPPPKWSAKPKSQRTKRTEMIPHNKPPTKDSVSAAEATAT